MSEVKSNRAWRLECEALRTELNVARAQATHDAAELRDCLDAIAALEAERDQLARQLYQSCSDERADFEGRPCPVGVDVDNLTRECDRLRAELAECQRLLHRYRNETPLGHQPHMIAHEVDAALADLKENAK